MNSDTIVAPATSVGSGALTIIRISGDKAFEILSNYFRPVKQKSFDIAFVKSQTIKFGEWRSDGELIDEVLVSFFKAPKSYTGENVAEISCHASPYIVNKILDCCIQAGARIAEPGEFTFRAYKNGKMDLGQAEAVADLIASESKAAHDVAISQLKGHFSMELEDMRSKLIEFTGLLELELDFAEEDVEFAERKRFFELIDSIKTRLQSLINSYSLGNVIKNGVPVAILGAPNAGKSTLLNALLGEERAIVSHIAGTTRDVIEDVIVIDGIKFRFIDTAGLRNTSDEIEEIGIKKALEKASKARLIIYLFDVNNFSEIEQSEIISKINDAAPDATLIQVANKIDECKNLSEKDSKYIYISAKEKIGLEELKKVLISEIITNKITENQIIVTNARHVEALKKTLQAIQDAEVGLKSGLSGDLVAIDLRQALYYMGSITGQVAADDILGYIFANFCIGK
ncbi:tRNA uridine-5-carboxymethylaminomethyl(34) synthesis GTPase MnmE [Schleiferia thermophila]|uniref:tRNA uridine-5-carboxymethylaminomethyl(34) synthesis GTPase MnmE n=1 Tax=Schleiferia thermophila TaxID=884107 RepID=UPI0004E7608E|nr:tRNA uridine-5-carboxymethylaminomethyl(34) synthesis GTPase MnmE [Schleiferia thermophila]KFD39445.1 tRNA modification GTPase TrmE [Schleiferia thermophila str. Yellowstone]